MNLGEKIRTYRLVNRMTQLEFSKKVRISRSYIADLEGGRNPGNFKIIEKISKKTETDILEWIDDEYLGERISMFTTSQYINELINDNKTLSEEDILKEKVDYEDIKNKIEEQIEDIKRKVINDVFCCELAKIKMKKEKLLREKKLLKKKSSESKEDDIIKEEI